MNVQNDKLFLGSSWGKESALCFGECTMKLSVFGHGREEKEMLNWFQAVFSQMTNLHLWRLA